MQFNDALILSGQFAPNTLDLTPLRDPNADPLAPAPGDPIVDVQLLEVRTCWQDIVHQSQTFSAETPADPAAADSPRRLTIPKGVKIIEALLRYRLPGCPTPHTVRVHPPHQLRLDCPADAPAVCTWLAKHLAFTCLLPLLLAAALLPDLTPDDHPEEDDPDTPEPPRLQS